MSTRLLVRYCANCKQDRATEVETLNFVGKETATCQACGHVTTTELTPKTPLEEGNRLW
jgi:hypothetical protein